MVGSSTVVCVDCECAFGGGDLSCEGWTSDRSLSSRVGDLLLVPSPFLVGLLLHPQGNFMDAFGGWLVACCGMLMDGASSMPIDGFGLATGGFFGFGRIRLVLCGVLAAGSFGAGNRMGVWNGRVLCSFQSVGMDTFPR